MNINYDSILSVKKYIFTGDMAGTITYEVTYEDGITSCVPSDNVYLKKWIDDGQPVEEVIVE